jgi:4-hydroxy-tetrahydrodipicolinate reductase
MPGGKYKVIQWATGNIGSRALKTVIEHHGLELVGLWVSSPEKAGKDAGELVGLPPTGTIASNSAADMIALEADCVLYMRQGIDWNEVCAILESGKNIVTTRGEFHYPPYMDPEKRAMVEAACAKGNTSIYSTGSSPGFVTEALSLPLLSLSRRHDCLTINEYADMTSRNSPDMIFNVMGYGVSPGQFDQRKVDHIKKDFGGSLSQIAAAIGLPLDDIEAVGEMSAAKTDKQIAAGLIPAGTVGALRITITGKHKGKPVLRFVANWYCTTDIEAEGWDLRESGWRVQTEGDTPLKVDITYPVTPEQYPLFTPGLTGHRAVNAVPVVCEAAPGIRTTVDMPQVIPHFARD